MKANLITVALAAILGIAAGQSVAASPEYLAGGDKILVAREASEAPRGADNERAGDRQRRGGREAGEAPRGADRNHQRRGRGGRMA